MSTGIKEHNHKFTNRQQKTASVRAVLPGGGHGRKLS
jgi:hypothetical protein